LAYISFLFNGICSLTAGSTVGEESKVQPKLSDSHMRESNASILSDGGLVSGEIARDVEDRGSQVSSRKSSVKDEV